MKRTKTHYYKGYAIHKPEGCKYWNVREIGEDGVINWCFQEAIVETLGEARNTIDMIIEEKKGERK